MPKTKGHSGATYDPAEFVIPAGDHQGHSERVWCRVQPLHERQVDIVLRSKQFPFRTKGDVVRWCVVRGLKMLEALEPNAIKGFMQQADTIQEMLRDEMYMQEFMGMFDTLQKVVNQHIGMGSQGEAARLVAQTKFHLDQIEGEPNWKRKALDKLASQFGHLLNQRPVGLDSFVHDEEQHKLQDRFENDEDSGKSKNSGGKFQ